MLEEPIPIVLEFLLGKTKIVHQELRVPGMSVVTIHMQCIDPSQIGLKVVTIRFGLSQPSVKPGISQGIATAEPGELNFADAQRVILRDQEIGRETQPIRQLIAGRAGRWNPLTV